MGSAGAINTLVLHDKVVTLKAFPPDVARTAADADADPDAVAGGHGDEGGGFEEEAWDGLTPVQARAFLSEVTERDSGKVMMMMMRRRSRSRSNAKAINRTFQ